MLRHRQSSSSSPAARFTTDTDRCGRARSLTFKALLLVLIVGGAAGTQFPKSLAAQETASSLGQSLIFHASFDDSVHADFAKGDPKLYTAETLRREKVQAGLHSEAVRRDPQEGRHGGSLRFVKKTDRVVFFQAAGNVPATDSPFAGSISFWLSVDPDKQLPPGYVDPLQITDKKWNDASLFVDFTQENRREFRLGVFSNYAFWNPTDRKWDDVPDSDRPLAAVKDPPFAAGKWTHVAVTFDGLNVEGESGEATLYLDGEPRGSIRRPQRLTWDPKKTAAMLGIFYVGGFDDLAIFDRALRAEEIRLLFAAPNGVKSLR